jgi:hypothetical protein
VTDADIDPRSPTDKFSDFMKASALRGYANRQRDIAEKFFRHLYYLLNAEQVEKEDPGDGMGYARWPAEDTATLMRILHLDQMDEPPTAGEMKDALSWLCAVTARGTFLGGEPSEVEPAWERELRWADRTEGATQLRVENEQLLARLRELLHSPIGAERADA